jgi:hypothetical protein
MGNFMVAVAVGVVVSVGKLVWWSAVGGGFRDGDGLGWRGFLYAFELAASGGVGGRVPRHTLSTSARLRWRGWTTRW